MPPEMLSFDPGPGEPALVRPYVRHLVRPTRGWFGEELPVPRSAFAPPPAPRPTNRPVPAHARRSLHTRPVRRRRRHVLTLSSGMLLVVLGSAVLAVGARDRSEASAPPVLAAIAAPRSGRLTTATVPAPAATGGPAAGAIVGAAGTCLAADGDRIRLRGCDGGTAQRWTAAADGTVRVLGRCLHAADGRIRLRGCDGGPPQRWYAGPGTTLVNAASGRCLAAPPRTAGCDRSPAQRWVLTAVPDQPLVAAPAR